MRNLLRMFYNGSRLCSSELQFAARARERFYGTGESAVNAPNNIEGGEDA
jgi:hypothetical protein